MIRNIFTTISIIRHNNMLCLDTLLRYAWNGRKKLYTTYAILFLCMAPYSASCASLERKWRNCSECEYDSNGILLSGFFPWAIWCFASAWMLIVRQSEQNLSFLQGTSIVMMFTAIQDILFCLHMLERTSYTFEEHKLSMVISIKWGDLMLAALMLFNCVLYVVRRTSEVYSSYREEERTPTHLENVLWSTTCFLIAIVLIVNVFSYGIMSVSL